MSFEKIPDDTPIDYEAYWGGVVEQSSSTSEVTRMGAATADAITDSDTEIVRPIQSFSPISTIRKTLDDRKSLHAKWSQVAREEGGGYSVDGDRWPKSKVERSIAQRKFRKRDRIGALRATRRTIEGGVYEINPNTGRSRWRDDGGSLSRYDRKTRKSIKKEEKFYRKVSEKISRYESA